MDPLHQHRPAPGVPVMTPPSGRVEAHSEQQLLVKFLPGVPASFDEAFLIQVAHFEAESVRVKGEGVFPRLGVNLPRHKDERYSALMEEATAAWADAAAAAAAVAAQGEGGLDAATTPGLKAGLVWFGLDGLLGFVIILQEDL